MNTLGYVRVSKEDSASITVENQKAALLAYDPAMKIFVDNGVSGETNLTSPTSAWTTKLLPALEANPTATLVVYSLDRLGRKKGKVLSAIEDVIDGGGLLYVAREGKTFDDPEEFSQSIELAFASVSNEAYRVEVKQKTKRALDVLIAAGVKLGSPPRLYEKDMKAILDLHARGLGYTAIGKVVRTKSAKDGKPVNLSYRIVRSVVEGTYLSREEWERRNAIARLTMRDPKH